MEDPGRVHAQEVNTEYGLVVGNSDDCRSIPDSLRGGDESAGSDGVVEGLEEKVPRRDCPVVRVLP